MKKKTIFKTFFKINCIIIAFQKINRIYKIFKIEYTGFFNANISVIKKKKRRKKTPKVLDLETSFLSQQQKRGHTKKREFL